MGLGFLSLFLLCLIMQRKGNTYMYDNKIWKDTIKLHLLVEQYSPSTPLSLHKLRLIPSREHSRYWLYIRSRLTWFTTFIPGLQHWTGFEAQSHHGRAALLARHGELGRPEESPPITCGRVASVEQIDVRVDAVPPSQAQLSHRTGGQVGQAAPAA